MSKSHEAGEDAPKHRPLPSVDMALLPHELRALRFRQVTLVVLALLILGAGVALTVARPWLAALVDRAPPSIAEAPWPGEQPTASAASPTAPACDPATTTPAAKPPNATPEPVSADPAPEATALIAGSTPEPEPASMAGPASPEKREPPLPTEGRTVQRFGQVSGFRGALIAAGISSADSDGLIASLNKLVDFRRAKPEDELVVERDSGGRLQAFEYRASVTERYRAERKPQGGFKATRVKVEIERKKIAKGGYISDSLGKALEALGIKSNIAGMFVEAFEGKIDFKKQARQGDSFKVLLDEEYVEGQHLGYGKVHALQYTSAKAGELLAFWFEADADAGDFFDESGRAMHGGWLRTPLRYDHISSRYNLRRRHPILKRIMPHEGIDYSAAPGTTVWAAADGVVSFVGQRGPNGNLVALQHGGGYESFYAHLLRISHGITRGVRVKQRQPIGAVGSTGRSTGPHLHFALKRQGHFIDPATQLNGPGKPLTEALLPRFKHTVSQLKRELAAIALAAAPAPAGAEQEAGEDFHEDAIDL
jgi:murein DD-endopeptidase MepM/ murein hydrolase activator NlpD